MGIKGHFFLECTILQSTHLLILVTLALLVMRNLQSKDTQSKGWIEADEQMTRCMKFSLLPSQQNCYYPSAAKPQIIESFHHPGIIVHASHKHLVCALY